MQIKDIDYAVDLNNAFVKLVLATFHGPILAELKQHAAFDLTDNISTAATQISASLNIARVAGVALVADRPSIALKGVALTPDSVIANAQVRVPLSVGLVRPVGQP